MVHLSNSLLTLAIKFTAGRVVREITLTLGPVTKARPDLDNPAQFSSPNVSPHVGKSTLFLTFSVTDTGTGLSEEERALLFQRFTQANPETHINYGGSGLGLYISRKLTELQGGQITVQSRLGEGSTFSFYIEAEQINPPTPIVGGNLESREAAAAGLTNLRTGASFIQNDPRQGQSGKTIQNTRRRRKSSDKGSLHILIVEVFIFCS
jgi:Histidine kinase-, DNA gyrase B-, and HSP90-like ATPase